MEPEVCLEILHCNKEVNLFLPQNCFLLNLLVQCMLSYALLVSIIKIVNQGQNFPSHCKLICVLCVTTVGNFH